VPGLKISNGIDFPFKYVAIYFTLKMKTRQKTRPLFIFLRPKSRNLETREGDPLQILNHISYFINFSLFGFDELTAHSEINI